MTRYFLANIIILILQLTFIPNSEAINSNPIISRGKPVFTSSGSAPYLVDNKFKGTAFTVSNNTWIAIKVGSGPSNVFFNYNNPSYSWSRNYSVSKCPTDVNQPVNYNILTSNNSTNGKDGNWTKALTINGNEVCTRGHLVNFLNESWIKIEILTGGGTLDEVEVFNASNNSDDIWFFPGTSISSNTYKGDPPASNYADLINKSRPAFNPVMIRGGIPCISLGDMVGNLSKYIDNTKDVKYWAIEQGTNDAWGGSNGGVPSFRNNMQKVVDACKRAGIQPIFARMISTNYNAAKWQVHQDYLKAIDDITKQNNLIAGPDLYNYFLKHPDELNSDGVHPNAKGGASIQRLWAEKMLPLYANVTALEEESAFGLSLLPNPSIDGIFQISTGLKLQNAYLEIIDLNGKILFSKIISDEELVVNTGLKAGLYIVKISNNNFVINDTLIIK